MYVLLTEKDAGGFDVPVRWQGSDVLAPELKEFTNVTFSKVVVKNGHLPHFGIFPLNVVHPPVGKRAKGDPVDTFNGTSVSREAAVENDPNYVDPKEPTDEEKAAAAAERLTSSRATKVLEVKAEAQKRILAVAPEWRQRNFSFLRQQISDKTKADAETSTAAAASTATNAHTDAQTAEAEAKTIAEAEGATDEQKAAYVAAQETTKTKAEAATTADAEAKSAKDAHDKEKADLAAQKTMWGKVDVIRSKSDEIEVTIAAMDQDTVNAFVVSTDSNWE